LHNIGNRSATVPLARLFELKGGTAGLSPGETSAQQAPIPRTPPGMIGPLLPCLPNSWKVWHFNKSSTSRPSEVSVLWPIAAPTLKSVHLLRFEDSNLLSDLASGSDPLLVSAKVAEKSFGYIGGEEEARG
jgi:hypothetical protein